MEGSNSNNEKEWEGAKESFQIKPEAYKYEAMTFYGRKGEVIQVVDSGKRLSVLFNGKEVGYLTYEIERRAPEFGIETDRMRFGYISVSNSSFKGTKLSALMLSLLAIKATILGLPVISVGHPDLESYLSYWVAMGFDFDQARRKIHKIRSEQINSETNQPMYPDLPHWTQMNVTEAEALTQSILIWASNSYRSYWSEKPWPTAEKESSSCLVQ